MRDNRPIFTIGHSTRPLDEFVALLGTYGVAVLVDIRRIPRSRTNPHFNAGVFPEALAREGIRYEERSAAGALVPRLRGRRRTLGGSMRASATTPMR